MYVELHDNLKRSIKVPASRVVVYDKYDNPIAVVVQIDNGQYIAVTAANKKFNEILKTLGIQQTVIVQHLDTKKLKTLD